MRLTPTNTVSDNSLRSENDSSQPDFGSSPGARTNNNQADYSTLKLESNFCVIDSQSSTTTNIVLSEV